MRTLKCVIAVVLFCSVVGIFKASLGSTESNAPLKEREVHRIPIQNTIDNKKNEIAKPESGLPIPEPPFPPPPPPK